MWSCAKVQNVGNLGTRFVRNQSWAVLVFPVVVVWILLLPCCHSFFSFFFSSSLLGSVETHQNTWKYLLLSNERVRTLQSAGFAYHEERAPAEKNARNCLRRLGNWLIFKQHDSLIQLVDVESMYRVHLVNAMVLSVDNPFFLDALKCRINIVNMDSA